MNHSSNRDQKMSKAIQVNQFGGPEVMEWCEVAVADPGPGEVRIRHTAVGLNFIDTYHRSGLYPLELPAGLGIEAAGVVDAVGPGVVDYSEGDSVAWVGMPTGAYAEQRTMPAAKLIRLPESVPEQIAAAAMLKGMTAWCLLRRCYAVQAGDTVLLYAAAGGVGLILAQWARHLGVNVIGVVRISSWPTMHSLLTRFVSCLMVLASQQSMTLLAGTLSFNHSIA